MVKAYQILPGGLMGNILELAPGRPAPAGYTFSEPKDELPEGAVYVWQGRWVVVTDADEIARYRAIAAEAELNEAKAARLAELHNAWLNAEADGVIMSSVGFAIDADDRANRDIQGLITGLEATGVDKTTFCAADNSFHEVTLAQLKTMQLELIGHAQFLYERKWTARTAIEAAKTVEEVYAVVIDFTVPEEEPESGE